MATADAPLSNYRFIPHSESKAREWVAALPLADPGETTRRLFHGLVDLNRRALAPQMRLANYCAHPWKYRWKICAVTYQRVPFHSPRKARKFLS